MRHLPSLKLVSKVERRELTVKRDVRAQSYYNSTVNGSLELKLWVREGGRKKRREVTASVYASAIDTNWGKAWVARVEPQGKGSKWQGLPKEGWLLLTSLPVVDEASARRVVQAYMQRWSVEETFS